MRRHHRAGGVASIARRLPVVNRWVAAVITERQIARVRIAGQGSAGRRTQVQ